MGSLRERIVRVISRRHSRRFWSSVVLVLTAGIILFLLLYRDKEENRLFHHKMRTIIDVYKWAQNPVIGCSNNFYAYGEEFVRLRYARLNPKTKRFSIPCSSEGSIPDYKFQFGREGTPLQAWLGNMTIYPLPTIKSLTLHKTTTLVINRIEAHNLYHTMCEWYNVFLLSKLLDFNPSKVDILLLDDRPVNHLDETWDVLFNNVLKYSSVDYNSAFKDLIWTVIGYESPMNFHFQTKLPYVREFREFFLKSFDIPDTKTLDCEKLTVTVFLRRDYMTHPERKEMTGGLVHRKFQNENEIIQEIKHVFGNAAINIVILEQMNMKEQLNLVVNTDVLIGMHGAGMSHNMFLPRHAVVFEMFPKYWGFFQHFRAIARWRQIKYFGWQNRSPDNEFPGYYTRIPVGIVRFHCNLMKNYLCGLN